MKPTSWLRRTIGTVFQDSQADRIDNFFCMLVNFENRWKKHVSKFLKKVLLWTTSFHLMCPLPPRPRVAEWVCVTSGPSPSLPLFGLPDNVLDTKVTAEQPRHTIYTTIKGERKIITFSPLYQWKNLKSLSFMCVLWENSTEILDIFPRSLSNILLVPLSPR